MKAPIPWLRVFAEGAVIVLSILLAFGIDAWWEGRQERAEEQEILQGLQEEFLWHKDRLQFHVDRHVGKVEAISKVLAAGHTGYEWADVGEMDGAYGAIIYTGTWDPGSGARDALIASGRLERLRDPNLRAALSSWGSVVDEVRDGESETRTLVREAIVPLTTTFGMPQSRFREFGWPAEQMSDQDAEAAYGALFSDSQFRSLVEYRLWWELGSGVEYRTALRAVDEILEMVAQSLDDAPRS